MEDDDNDEPIATAVFEMVMKQFGPRAADRLLLDALLIALCREIPPLAAQIEAVLQDLSGMPQALEPQAQQAFDAQLAIHMGTLAALVKSANTR
jgi:hypothetical protein